MSISLASINIEGSKHLDTVGTFLKERNPEVVCLQELCEGDIPFFEDLLDAKCYYAHMMTLPADSLLSTADAQMPIGVGVFSRLPVTRQVTHYYHKVAGPLPEFDVTDMDSKRRTQNCLFVVSDIEKEGTTYRVGTTHFTWTPNGDADEYQRTDVQKLLEIASAESPLVLCGDFNAPRGREIFSKIAASYRDNIPAHYETSVDIALHRSGKDRAHELIDKMVDGLFSSPEYHVSDPDLVFGVSDHAAIVGTIERA